jgi:dTDP-4-dehydrorhamnose reductase
MKISVIGSQGQVGSELVSAGLARGWDIQALDHSEVDVTDPQSLKTVLSAFGPNYVINTAAFHNVGECEKQPEIANNVNAIGAKNVAEIASELSAVAVYFSTDYVFDGNIEFGMAYVAEDPTNPLNAYGVSKREGEQATLEVSPANLVIRISSVFGIKGNKSKGGNFVDKILNRVSSGQDATVPGDNRMSPTYAVDAAVKTLALVEAGNQGLWHANNTGSVSWFSFAQAIASISKSSGKVLEAQGESSEAILRPKNSSLSASNIDGISQELAWYSALERYLREKGAA